MAVAASGLIGFGWYAHSVWADAQAKRGQDKAITKHIKDETASHNIGAALEAGREQYGPAAQKLDKEIDNAKSADTGNRFNDDSVRRTAARIASGKAARERASQVR